jgi:hypothetical protein
MLLKLVKYQAYMRGMPKVGPYSRCATLRKLDKRTKEARLVQSMRAELSAHVGGKPNIAQRILIDQAAELRLRIALMEAEGTDPGEMTERRQVQFLAWTGALTRLLKDLGLEGAPQKAPSLGDVMRKPAPHRSATA